MGSLVCEDGLGECGGRPLAGWYEGLLAEGFRWRLREAVQVTTPHDPAL